MSRQIRPRTISRFHTHPGSNIRTNNGQSDNIRRRNVHTLPPNPGRLQSLDNNLGGVQHQTQSTSTPARMQHQGAYSVIVPDENKRRQILENAQREERLFEQHKSRMRPARVSCGGVVGGPRPDQSQIREAQQIEHNRARQAVWGRIAEKKKETKRLEDAEIERKKREARRKAERAEEAERRRDARLRDDHRRTNAAFLDRLEQQTKNKH